MWSVYSHDIEHGDHEDIVKISLSHLVIHPSEWEGNYAHRFIQVPTRK